MNTDLICITAWPRTDIDVLACAVAYRDIMRAAWYNQTYTEISNVFWWTIPDIIRRWDLRLDAPQNRSNSKYIVVDISDPGFINSAVTDKNIIELWDHHPGFEKYWERILEKNAHIEHIGACATLIFEQAVKLNVLDRLEPVSIDLLLTAILSNTLNFKASITHSRDIFAYQKLTELSHLSSTWSQEYFGEVECDIHKNIVQSLLGDLKIVSLFWKNVAVSQIELWRSKDFIQDNISVIVETLWNIPADSWMFTSPEISTWVNHIICDSEELRRNLTETIECTFTENIWVTQRLWLRKEILKAAQSKNN